jgi:hypothetical protein
LLTLADPAKEFSESMLLYARVEEAPVAEMFDHWIVLGLDRHRGWRFGHSLKDADEQQTAQSN